MKYSEFCIPATEGIFTKLKLFKSRTNAEDKLRRLGVGYEEYLDISTKWWKSDEAKQLWKLIVPFVEAKIKAMNLTLNEESFTRKMWEYLGDDDEDFSDEISSNLKLVRSHKLLVCKPNISDILLGGEIEVINKSATSDSIGLALFDNGANNSLCAELKRKFPDITCEIDSGSSALDDNRRFICFKVSFKKALELYKSGKA